MYFVQYVVCSVQCRSWLCAEVSPITMSGGLFLVWNRENEGKRKKEWGNTLLSELVIGHQPKCIDNCLQEMF